MPVKAEIAERRDIYWHPYHDALAAELARVRAQHGRGAVGRPQHLRRAAVALSRAAA
ncbi:MAG: N-formylglutamate amidohydrolase [Rubrivivax sp.]